MRARLLGVLFLVAWAMVRTAPAAALPTVTHEGRAYVELFRVAESLGAALEAAPESPQATLRVGARVVTLTRNWARIMVDQTPILMDSPVRVRSGVWLVPEVFVQVVVPTLRAAPPRSAPPAASTVAEPQGKRAAPRVTTIPADPEPVRPPATARAARPEPPGASGGSPAPGAPPPAAPPRAASAAPVPPAPARPEAPPARRDPAPSTAVATPPRAAPDAPARAALPDPEWTPAAPPAAPRPAPSVPPPARVTRAPAPEPAESTGVLPRPSAPPAGARAPEPAAATAGKSAAAPAGANAKAEPRATPEPPRPAAAGRGAVTLSEVRHRSYPTFTRIVVETSGPAAHRIEPTAGKEARLRVVGLGAEPQVTEIGDGFITEARLERAGADTLLRVAFEGAAGELRASTLGDPFRLVLDFHRPAEPRPREGRAALTPLRTIVLDAGHGGHDSGAVGPAGLMEKELVLDVTRRVARLAEERLGVKVLLTRDGDYFVPLRDRTSFANRERADLFVSIHANAHREAASEGVETYFLSSEATDNAARQTAAAENSVVQLERPAGGRGRGDILKAILWDLAQSEFQEESSRLAEIVQDSITVSMKLPNRGVKQAGFYVLGGAAMPAILVEIGFVSNPREERKLKDARHRDEIARAIFAGIAEYKTHWDQRTRAVAR